MYYCSTRFHEIVGMTLRTYICRRRLTKATLEIRDTNKRIIDIAIKYCYSSQEALTRAFVKAYGLTPSAYRKNPKPIPLFNMQVVFLPEHYQEGEIIMKETYLKNPEIRMEFIPAHKYIGIWDNEATCYSEFWKKHDCDKICGIIESMRNVSNPVVGCHMAGWYKLSGERKYFYGFGVPNDYDGYIPDGFTIREFPASYYLVFFHPPFDYLKDCSEVIKRVEDLAWNYDIDLQKYDARQYEWNEDICQAYQRHYPEVLGYEVLRPVKKK